MHAFDQCCNTTRETILFTSMTSCGRVLSLYHGSRETDASSARDSFHTDQWLEPIRSLVRQNISNGPEGGKQ